MTPPAALVDTVGARGRAAWPGVTVLPDRIAAHLAALPAPPLPAHAADLYLACACAGGDPTALALLEDGLLRQVPLQVRHLGDASFADEVQQRLRIRLLVATAEGPARIGSYAGRGPLAGWLRAAAVRVAIDLRRERHATHALPDGAAELLVADHDPALAFIRVEHREVFRQALHEALASLPERERTALRLHLCGGLSAVKIGLLLGVHHATVSRWLIASRSTVFLETRRRLTERLRLSATDFHSLVRLVQSQLDLSLSRVLAPDPQAGRAPPDPEVPTARRQRA